MSIIPSYQRIWSGEGEVSLSGGVITVGDGQILVIAHCAYAVTRDLSTDVNREQESSD
jgi:hypothetical protein